MKRKVTAAHSSTNRGENFFSNEVSDNSARVGIVQCDSFRGNTLGLNAIEFGVRSFFNFCLIAIFKTVEHLEAPEHVASA